MSEVSKLTEEELRDLRSANTIHQANKNTIADIEISISELESQKSSILMNAANSKINLQEQEKKITEKYGQVRVDLSDGSITKL